MRPKTWDTVQEIMSVKEAAELLGLSKKTMERNCRSGRIKASRSNGTSGKYIILKSELMKFVGAI